MIALICFVWSVATAPFKSKSRLELENAALRHQVVVLQRKVRGRIEFANRDRLFLALPPRLRIRCASPSAFAISASYSLMDFSWCLLTMISSLGSVLPVSLS